MRVNLDTDLVFDSLQASREDEKRRMMLMLQLYVPRQSVYDAVLKAYNDPDWDWYEESDGCTGVTELHSPKGFRFPPCVLHDYYCYLASKAKTLKEAQYIRFIGDKMFFFANIDFRASTWRSVLRWAGVRLWWLCVLVFFWKKPTTEGAI